MKKIFVMLVAVILFCAFENVASGANAAPRGRSKTYKTHFRPFRFVKKMKLERKKNNFRYMRRLNSGVGGPCVGNPYFQNRKR